MSDSRLFMTPFKSASEAFSVIAERFEKGTTSELRDPLALAEDYKVRFALEHVRIICEMSDAEDSTYAM